MIAGMQEVYKYLYKNDNKSKEDTIKKIVKKFKLKKNEAEKVYEDWKKNYMNAKFINNWGLILSKNIILNNLLVNGERRKNNETKRKIWN